MKKKTFCENCYSTVEMMEFLNEKSPWLEIHHIRPKLQGGKDKEDNLITLCRWCHVKTHTNEKGRINYKYIDSDMTLAFLEIKGKF